MIQKGSTMTAKEDREVLGWSMTKYRDLAEALGDNCFINVKGNKVRIHKTKRKKLLNMKYYIKRNKVFICSPIHIELLRRINIQIAKNQKIPD